MAMNDILVGNNAGWPDDDEEDEEGLNPEVMPSPKAAVLSGRSTTAWRAFLGRDGLANPNVIQKRGEELIRSSLQTNREGK